MSNRFLNWCKCHMFSVVAGLAADEETSASSKLVGSIAERYHLRVPSREKHIVGIELLMQMI